MNRAVFFDLRLKPSLSGAADQPRDQPACQRTDEEGGDEKELYDHQYRTRVEPPIAPARTGATIPAAGVPQRAPRRPVSAGVRPQKGRAARSHLARPAPPKSAARPGARQSARGDAGRRSGRPAIAEVPREPWRARRADARAWERRRVRTAAWSGNALRSPC